MEAFHESTFLFLLIGLAEEMSDQLWRTMQYSFTKTLENVQLRKLIAQIFSVFEINAVKTQ